LKSNFKWLSQILKESFGNINLIIENQMKEKEITIDVDRRPYKVSKPTALTSKKKPSELLYKSYDMNTDEHHNDKWDAYWKVTAGKKNYWSNITTTFEQNVF